MFTIESREQTSGHVAWQMFRTYTFFLDPLVRLYLSLGDKI